jgi:hypothetical protein
MAAEGSSISRDPELQAEIEAAKERLRVLRARQRPTAVAEPAEAKCKGQGTSSERRTATVSSGTPSDVQKVRDYVAQVDGERWADEIPDDEIAGMVDRAKADLGWGRTRGWLGIVHARLAVAYGDTAAASGGGGERG